MTKVENHFTISPKLGIWLACFFVAGFTSATSIDIGIWGIICWAVVIIGIALWVRSFFVE